VDKAVAKVRKLGGDVCVPKSAVPGLGFFSVCTDTEGNTFAVWEVSKTAK
jgi:predicted enzyme related to lactoylglutathione lyase